MKLRNIQVVFNNMPNNFEIEIKNDNRESILKQMKEATEVAMEAIGQQAEGYAKIACPVDTGNLRNSISHQYVPGDNAEYIGTNVEYAPYVEFGTCKQKAKPFLRSSASNHAEEYREIFEYYYKSKLNTK